VEQCDPDISPLGHARQSIKIKQGIASAVAKQITGFIRDGKFKVTDADSGRRGAGQRQEPGRIADRHRRRARP
jgi:hypothetical protein